MEEWSEGEEKKKIGKGAGGIIRARGNRGREGEGGGVEQGGAMTIISERGADVKVGPCSCQLSILPLGVRDSKYLVSIQPQTWL